MERLYLAITGDSATIHHRPTHEFIACGNVKDMTSKVKELLKMSTKEFYEYLVKNVNYIRLEGKTHKTYKHNEAEQEDWYKKAWLQGTNLLLKKNKIKMVDEEVPYEYIDQLLDERRKAQSTLFSSNNSIVDEEEKWTETEELKQPPRKLIRKSSAITPKEDEEDITEAMSVAERVLRKIKHNKQEQTQHTTPTNKKRIIEKRH